MIRGTQYFDNSMANTHSSRLLARGGESAVGGRVGALEGEASSRRGTAGGPAAEE